VAEYLKERMN